MSQQSPILVKGDTPPRQTTPPPAAAAASPAAPAPPPPAASPLMFSVLTWNVAECLPAKVAPRDWTLEKSTSEIIRNIQGLGADVVCLQEAPSKDFTISEDYLLVGATPSHCGWVQLHVKPMLMAFFSRVQACGPSVILELKKEDTTFSVASMHLEPFASGGPKRLRQLAAMQGACSASAGYVFAGDANIRTEEGKEFVSSGLVQDAHATFQRSRPFTWDTYKNKYHGHDPAALYTSNYDRIWTAGCVAATDCRVCCDHPASSEAGHFLSDHFGLFARLILSPSIQPLPATPSTTTATGVSTKRPANSPPSGFRPPPPSRPRGFDKDRRGPR